MKLLTVGCARVVWLFPTAEVNPRGKDVFSLIEALVQRYAFRDVPNISEALKANKGIKLAGGVYSDAEYGSVQITFSIFEDGLVAETRTDTSATERFFDDVMDWAVNDLGFSLPVYVRKQYASELYVHTKKSLTTLNPKLEKFCRLLSNKAEIFGKVEYELTSLAFQAQQVSQFTPATFRFEREASAPFESDRYYSIAPLPTGEHLELLTELEAILRT